MNQIPNHVNGIDIYLLIDNHFKLKFNFIIIKETLKKNDNAIEIWIWFGIWLFIVLVSKRIIACDPHDCNHNKIIINYGMPS